MAQYNITVDDEILKELFSGEQGMSQLSEQVCAMLVQTFAQQFQAIVA